MKEPPLIPPDIEDDGSIDHEGIASRRADDRYEDMKDRELYERMAR